MAFYNHFIYRLFIWLFQPQNWAVRWHAQACQEVISATLRVDTVTMATQMAKWDGLRTVLPISVSVTFDTGNSDCWCRYNQPIGHVKDTNHEKHDILKNAQIYDKTSENTIFCGRLGTIVSSALILHQYEHTFHSVSELGFIFSVIMLKLKSLAHVLLQ